MLYRPTINLLPDNKKDRLHILIRFIFAKDLLELSLLFCSLLAIVFIWSWLTLQDEYNNMAQSAILVNSDNSVRNREIRETNGILRQFNHSTVNYIQVTQQLNELIMTLPDDIKLNSIVLDQTPKQLIISGTARTRAALLNYENVVKQYSWLKNVTAPVSQLLQKENINFETKAELNLPATDAKPTQQTASVNSDR